MTWPVSRRHHDGMHFILLQRVRDCEGIAAASARDRWEFPTISGPNTDPLSGYSLKGPLIYQEVGPDMPPLRLCQRSAASEATLNSVESGAMTA